MQFHGTGNATAIFLRNGGIVAFCGVDVFVPENVTALRRISWCCAGAAVLCLAAVFICYRPFAVLAVAAGFMALLVRVLKNAFAQAVRMKNELDYTI